MSPTAASGIKAPTTTGKRTLKQLRREAGYRSARDFADHLGIPCPTYSRWEQRPTSMPLKAAWAIADDLGTSIDAIADRTDPEPAEKVDPLRESYEQLSPVSRAMFDEYLIYLTYREGRL